MFKFNRLIQGTLFALAVLLLVNGGLVSAESSASPAAILTVGSGFGCIHPNLQEAVIAANDGDTIHVFAGTFSGNAATVNISNKSLTIIGGFQVSCHGTPSSITTLDGAGMTFDDSIIELSGATVNRTVELHNFVIQNGRLDDDHGGGIDIQPRFAVSLHNVTIQDNTSDLGGGVYIRGGQATSLTLYDSTIVSNAADDDGGGIYCENANLLIQADSHVGQVVNGNTAFDAGGGVFTDGCIVTVFEAASIEYNRSHRGGGIFADNGSTLFLTDRESEISNNTATTGLGGGLYLDNASQFNATKGHVDGNYSADHGGGIAAFGGSAVVFNDISQCTDERCLTLNRNRAGDGAVVNIDGGGVYAFNSTVAFERTYVDNNYARGNGAAVYQEIDHNFGVEIEIFSAEATLFARNEAGDKSIVEIEQGHIADRDATLSRVTFAYNYTTAMDSSLLDIRAQGSLNIDMNGLIVRGDYSDNQNGIATLTAPMTCSILPTGWPFSNLVNLIGAQDVQFRDSANDDFRVESTSPAVDICAATTGSPDLYGRSRAVNMPATLGNQTISMGAYDAGAFEFGGVFGLNNAPCAYLTFAAAYADAAIGDTIAGLPSPTVQHGMGDIDKTISVQSSGQAGCETVNPTEFRLAFNPQIPNQRALTISNGASVTLTQVALGSGEHNDGGNVYLNPLSELTLIDSVISGGEATQKGGGIYADNAVLTLIDSNLLSNQAHDGGALYATNASQIELRGDSAIGQELANGNVATKSGGGVYLAANSHLTMSDQSRISSNNADSLDGGGVYLKTSSSLTMSDQSMLSGNQAGRYGGGISLTRESHLTVSGAGEISQNSSDSGGGGIYAGVDVVVTIADGFRVQNNSADLNGGGIYMSDGEISLSNAVVLSNTAITGGGMYLGIGTTAVLSGTTIINGNVVSATVSHLGYGGGIYMTGVGTVLTMTQQSTVANNTAHKGGGGIAVNQAAHLILLDAVEIHHNTSRLGGGIYAAARLSVLGNESVHPSLHHNAATERGGGFFVSDAGSPITLANVDIYSNTAGSGAGGYVTGQTVNLVNTVFADNVATNLGGGLVLALGAVGHISAEFTPSTRAAGCDSASLPANHFCSHFLGNQANQGAAISVSAATLYLTQTAVTENIATFFNSSTLYSSGDASEVTLNTTLFRDNTGAVRLIHLTDAIDASILNSTIYRNDGKAITAEATANSLQIERSIIWDNTQGTEILAGGNFGSACNIAQAQVAGSQAFGAGDDSANNPMLDGEGRLFAGSPAIDACAGGIALDLDGVARPINGAGVVSGSEFDRGAFEFDPAMSPTAVVVRGVAVSAETPSVFTFVLILLMATVGGFWRMLWPQHRQ